VNEMLEMRAIVMSIRGDEAEISPLGGGCGQCDSVNGCGSNKVSQMFCSSQPRKFLVRNQLGAHVGDEVSVSLPEGVLLRSSWRMYLLPLLLMLGGGLIGASLAGETASRDGYALIGSMIGLVSGFVWGKISSAADRPQAVVQSIVSPRVNS
jgi:sigma-E factor negative regulatory protein RseC